MGNCLGLFRQAWYNPKIKMKAEEGSQREMGLPEDAEREARWMTLKVKKETRVRMWMASNSHPSKSKEIDFPTEP